MKKDHLTKYIQTIVDAETHRKLVNISLKSHISLHALLRKVITDWTTTNQIKEGEQNNG